MITVAAGPAGRFIVVKISFSSEMQVFESCAGTASRSLPDGTRKFSAFDWKPWPTK